MYTLPTVANLGWRVSAQVQGTIFGTADISCTYCQLCAYSLSTPLFGTVIDVCQYVDIALPFRLPDVRSDSRPSNSPIS